MVDGGAVFKLEESITVLCRNYRTIIIIFTDTRCLSLLSIRLGIAGFKYPDKPKSKQFLEKGNLVLLI